MWPAAPSFAVGAAWYLAWAAFPVFGLTFTFTPLLFPTGRLPSRRWRPIAWLAGIEITAASVLAALQPTLPLENEGRTIPNPIGISGLPDTLSAELLTVVDLTVQPAQVSLWLRPTSLKSPPQAQPSNRANVA